MAWTTPKTNFNAGDVLTAAEMNAIGENLDAIGAAWTAYTPTWTNLTVGNGSQDCAYIAAGKLHTCRIEFTFGSTSTVSGSPEFTLPNGVSISNGYASGFVFAYGTLRDDSASQGYVCPVLTSSSDTRLRVGTLSIIGGTFLGNNIINASTPFTWTTGDKIMAAFMFEAA